ncbi:hypothetical protein GQ457_03G015580 [Hibiscus cannabinus]
MFAASFDSKIGCLYSVFDVKKQGKPVWVVRARNWKLRGGENRLSGLLEGVSVSGNVFTWPIILVIFQFGPYSCSSPIGCRFDARLRHDFLRCVWNHLKILNCI